MPYDLLNVSTDKPVLSWANHELGTAETKMAKNVAALPFVFKHVSLMPNVHLGKGLTIGQLSSNSKQISFASGQTVKAGQDGDIRAKR
ncbi:MAG: RtcB family protein [Phormidium tanganyikae FI6-MK23]|jgi:tRNA-splicing ligase RtcB|nr:RtcB family protein [Phormidium tanganyikae FI6-MK23]